MNHHPALSVEREGAWARLTLEGARRSNPLEAAVRDTVEGLPAFAERRPPRYRADPE